MTNLYTFVFSISAVALITSSYEFVTLSASRLRRSGDALPLFITRNTGTLLETRHPFGAAVCDKVFHEIRPIQHWSPEDGKRRRTVRRDSVVHRTERFGNNGQHPVLQRSRRHRREWLRRLGCESAWEFGNGTQRERRFARASHQRQSRQVPSAWAHRYWWIARVGCECQLGWGNERARRTQRVKRLTVSRFQGND